MLDLLALPTLPLSIGIAFLMCAGYWESRTMMVPNKLTLGVLLAGLLFATTKSLLTPEVPGGLGAALVGMVCGVVFLLPLYVFIGLGAGCVKAQAAFGAWLCCAMGVGTGVTILVLATVCACIVLAANAYSHVRLLEHDQEHGQQLIHGQLPLSLGALVGLVATTWM